MLSFVSSLVLGLFITSITSLIGCGEGGDGSVVNEGVSSGVSNNDGNNNGVSDEDVGNDDVGNNGVGTRPRAFLKWKPVKHHRSVTYTVHFGKQSSGQAGSCNYERSGDVSKPHATVTGLDSNTLYFFAVSTYDGYLRSQCSNEVSKLTP